jgi:hypothetical protein
MADFLHFAPIDARENSRAYRLLLANPALRVVDEMQICTLLRAAT